MNVVTLEALSLSEQQDRLRASNMVVSYAWNNHVRLMKQSMPASSVKSEPWQ